jgi:predicted RNase H-like HicB family nuclease
MKRHYTVLLEENPGGVYTATVPLLPGCVSQGDSIDAALIHVREAIEGYIESLKHDGEEAPEQEGTFRLAEVEVDMPYTPGASEVLVRAGMNVPAPA